MLIRKISTSIYTVLILSSLAWAQKATKHQKIKDRSLRKGTIEVSKDTVFYQGKAILIQKGVKGSLGNKKQYLDLNGTEAFIIERTELNSQFGAPFNVDFNSPQMQAVVESTGFKDVLMRLINGQVIGNGKINSQQASSFAANNQYSEEVTIGYGDTSSSSASSSSLISFTLRNLSSSTIKYWIGDANGQPGFSSGSFSSIGGNGVTNISESGNKQFCIIDEGQKAISCTSITSSDIEINSSGNGFQ